MSGFLATASNTACAIRVVDGAVAAPHLVDPSENSASGPASPRRSAHSGAPPASFRASTSPRRSQMDDDSDVATPHQMGGGGGNEPQYRNDGRSELSAVPREVDGLDPAAIDRYFRPDGRWARRCGDLVRTRRLATGLSATDLARYCGLTAPTLYKIEVGRMLPSDRVRAAIAYHLRTEPEALWPFPSRHELELISAAGT